MKIKELKEFIKDLPDNMPIRIESLYGEISEPTRAYVVEIDFIPKNDLEDLDTEFAIPTGIEEEGLQIDFDPTIKSQRPELYQCKYFLIETERK